MNAMMPLNDAEIQDIATAAADAAVRKLFLTMGVDTSDDKALIEMQRDFAHVRNWRKAKEKLQTVTISTAIGTLVTGLLGLLWVTLFQRGGH